jgi:NAD(P)-dependent dehydrogenase (short-subunit alcohol dehydrogenase family)
MEPPLPALDGKVCLVTGATSGIGLVTARELARRRARVVLIGRDAAKSAAVVAQIRSETGNQEVDALLADLSSQQAIRELAGHILERCARVDVLVNNAGGIWARRVLTVDRLEMTFAVNHLAYFLLTLLLLDRLKASAPARVVNVSSGAHRSGAMNFNDLMGERRYNGWQAYCQSKLANLLFTYELARRIQGTGVTVNALHPGWVATGIARNNGWRRWLWDLAARFFALGPEEGARTAVYLASSPEVDQVTRKYFFEQHPVSSSPASHDDKAAQRLWERSMKLTGQTGEQWHWSRAVI